MNYARFWNIAYRSYVTKIYGDSYAKEQTIGLLTLLMSLMIMFVSSIFFIMVGKHLCEVTKFEFMVFALVLYLSCYFINNRYFQIHRDDIVKKNEVSIGEKVVFNSITVICLTLMIVGTLIQKNDHDIYCPPTGFMPEGFEFGFILPMIM